MSTLAKYNPLKRISLPGGDIVDPKGLIVVVGPNSSGKSLFLKDIANHLSTGMMQFVVCKLVQTQRPANIQEFWDDLLKQRYIHLVPKSNVFATYVPSAIGNEKFERVTFNLDSLTKAFTDFSSGNPKSTASWFRPIGNLLVAFLSLDERRSLCDHSKSFDHEAASPATPLQGLYVDTNAQDRLTQETSNVFGNAVWLDNSKNGIYRLRLSDSKDLPSVGAMRNPFDAEKHSAIENEGDGLRSYVGICLSLLLAARPVSLIDEPELCLHPPQAYHLGRFIGQYARNDHVTIVATHSSHVLRGILETNEQVKVVRLSRVNKQFRSRLVAENELMNNLRNPRTRAESVLDGIFSKGVILVESEGDREEYQAASEAISDFPAREIHIVPVGGNGGFVDPLRFYRSLGTPVAIIADLDTVCEVEKVISIVNHLVGEPEKQQEICDKLRTVIARIKELPPSVSEGEVKEKLDWLSNQTWQWKSNGDNRLRRELNELEGRLKRIQRLKEGGLDAYKDIPDIHVLLCSVVSDLASIGFFLVPIGELEDWVASLASQVSKRSHSKSERASIVANIIREAENRTGDIWEFIQKVFDFLKPTI